MKIKFLIVLFLFNPAAQAMQPSNKITIFSHPVIGSRGPESVVKSLLNGLNKINVEFNHNPVSEDQMGEHVIVLSDVPRLKRCIELKKQGKIKSLLAGPNLMVRPSECNRILLSPEIDLVIVPSQWVLTAYVEQEPSLADHIALWFAGVDLTHWIPKPNRALDSKKVLVYWKTESEDFYKHVESMLKDFDFEPICLRYGSFNQIEYKKLLEAVSFAVFVSVSESQGIALGEAWAMDVPTINWDPEALAAHGRVYSECSSCPYLSQATGLRWKTFEEFKNILANLKLSQFSPRAWMVEYMSDEVCARMMCDLIQKIQKASASLGADWSE